MYFADHPPPHVHVVGRDFEMLVAIRDSTILAGKVPSRVERTAMRWIRDNRQALLRKWKECE